MLRRKQLRGSKELFLVVVKDSAGRRRGSLTPEEFRQGTRCPKTVFLSECVDRWNEFQSQQGAEDRVSIEFVPLVKRRSKR